MKQLGDLTQLHGANIPPVDVITFGSPCTRLSVAGRHDGFDITFCCRDNDTDSAEPHYQRTIKATDKYKYIYEDICPICRQKLTETNESALFFHAVRIIAEMREATHGRYPTFAVWENVGGAFSSNRGEDFRQVLEEILSIGGNTVSVPRPAGGKWLYAGSVVGDQISVCWRTLDAQYWGVPQRRERIFLAADFGGEGSSEILFNQTGVCWHPAPRRETREGTAGTAETGAGTASATRSDRESGVTAGFSAGQGAKAGGIGWQEDCAPTLKAGSGLNDVPCAYIPAVANTLTARADSSPCADRGHSIVSVFDARGNGDGETVPTITGDHNNCVTDYTAVLVNDYCIAGNIIGRDAQNGGNGFGYQEEVSYTLTAADRHAVASGIDCRNIAEIEELFPTLQAKNQGGYSLNYTHAVRIFQSVRRLTPLECERLQGYPDGWTDLPGASGSARYKALGNSVAIPCVVHVLGVIADELHRRGNVRITLGSLFDGIGGFPLAGTYCGITPVWASEIEAFPIAVTNYHFGEE